MLSAARLSWRCRTVAAVCHSTSQGSTATDWTISFASTQVNPSRTSRPTPQQDPKTTRTRVLRDRRHLEPPRAEHRPDVRRVAPERLWRVREVATCGAVHAERILWTCWPHCVRRLHT